MEQEQEERIRRIKALRNEIDAEEEEYGDERSSVTRSSHQHVGSLDASYANKFYLSVKDNETDMKFPQGKKNAIDANSKMRPVEDISQEYTLKNRALIAVPESEIEDN